MSDQNISESLGKSLSGFDGVWQRVTATKDSFSDEAALQGFIQDTWQLSQQYTSLARHFSGSGHTTLSTHAAQCAAQAKRLRAEYFILTGQAYAPAPVQEAPGGRLARLRQQLIEAQALAVRYETAAGQTKHEPLSSLYAAFADQLRITAQEDRALLLHAFS